SRGTWPWSLSGGGGLGEWRSSRSPALDREDEQSEAEPDAAAGKCRSEAGKGGHSSLGIGRLHRLVLECRRIVRRRAPMKPPRGNERGSERGIGVEIDAMRPAP